MSRRVSERPGPRVHATTLIVIDKYGRELPGFLLRAGDYVTQTEYDHDRRTMTAHVVHRPPTTLRIRVRRWWEGLRR